MPNDQELVDLITRGLEAAKERHSLMSERVLRMELQFDQVSKLAETEKLKMRVEQLEVVNKKHEDKQIETNRRIWGLVAGMIMLLLGFLFNFIKINLR